MKKTIFVDLEGTLGTYAKPVKTASTSSFKNVQNLQVAVNETVKQYAVRDAFAENCKELWESLYSILDKAAKQMTKTERSCSKYQEILDWFFHLGNDIAFYSIRWGISRSYFDTKRAYDGFKNTPTENSELLVKRFLDLRMRMISVSFSDPSTQMFELKRLENMSDDELLTQALKEQNDIIKKYKLV